MKKPLLLLSAAALAATAAFAAGPQTVTFSKSGVTPAAMQNAPAKAGGESGSIVYTKAGEPANIYVLNNIPNRGVIYLAFEMTVEDQAPYIGAQISAVNVMAGCGSGNANFPVSKVNVFVTESDNTVPTKKTAGTISTEPYSVTSIALSEPYTITGEKPIYIGYMLGYSNPQFYFLPSDEIPTPAGVNNMMVSVVNKVSDAPSYVNYSDQQPGSLCLSCNISGDNLPMNIAQATTVKVPAVIGLDEPFSYDVTFKNVGANEITSVTVKTEFAGKSVENDFTISPALASGEAKTVTVTDLVNSEPGVYTLKSSIVKANGVEIANPAVAAGSFDSYSGVMDRRAVIEEGTGTWCGWCPRGIVMLEYIKNTYPDFIRIAVHSGDAMAVSEYSAMLGDYMQGLPGAVVNREFDTQLGYGYSVAQLHEVADEAYNYITSSKTYCGFEELTASCRSDYKTAYVNAKVKFAINSDTQHLISYVVVEDGVTRPNGKPYSQTNYYAGGSNGEMDGWEKKPKDVEWIYEDVARSITGYPGIPGSLPEQISEGIYEHGAEIPIDKVKGDDFRVIAFIVNTKTGVIVNAEEISLNKVTSVEGIADDARGITIEVVDGNVIAEGASNVAVYTLDGRNAGTTGLASGVYIVKADNVTRKVRVK